MAHTELVHGWTTAAVINWSMNSPETPASALDFMPSQTSHDHAETEPELSEEQWEAKAAYQQQVLQLAAEMKARSGPLYERCVLGKN